MRSRPASFFITGGTLPPGAPSYVERRADADLLSGLLEGEFCFVLDTRQMGKSSLIVRTGTHLREQGIRTALLDLTAVGSNVTPLEWYDGLLTLLSEQLDICDEMEQFWRDNARLGPVQRWMAAIQNILLRDDDQFVIFIDEIDAVLSLPFNADEFFTAIRECYNRRATDSRYERISFCLVGVAAPSDLIRDPHASPFNIGRRIVLTDFLQAEAASLAGGLSSPGLLERILYWTRGHPYMTQRLCRALEDEERANPEPVHDTGIADVDRICSEFFLTPRAREVDTSLAFVRSRILADPGETAALLDLYAKVRSGIRVPDDETNPLCSTLKLAGIAGVTEGRLVTRNRIMESVFDDAWIRENTPAAETRRQRAAFMRGATRTAAVSAVALVLFAMLTYTSLNSARRARAAEERYRLQAGIAQAQTTYANHLVYDFSVMRASQWYATDGLSMTEQQLNEAVPGGDATDLRGFEWYYLHHVCHSYIRELHSQPVLDFGNVSNGIVGLAVSPDGMTLASASYHSLTIWNISTGAQIFTRLYDPRYGLLASVAWSPDSRRIAIGTFSGHVDIFDAHTGRTIQHFDAGKQQITSLEFSHRGSLLITGSNDGTARIWDARTLHEIRHVMAVALRGIWAVAISPDDRILATGGDDGIARLWDVATGKPLRAMRGHSWYIYALAFSPDGKSLATGSGDTTAVIWDVASGSQRAVMRGHASYIYSLAYSPDGKMLATGAWDHTVRLWEAQTGTPIRVLETADNVWAVAFCMNGSALAVGCSDSVVRLWSSLTSQLYKEIHADTGRVYVSYSTDAARFVTCSDSGIAQIRDSRSGVLLRTLPRQPGALFTAILRGDRCRTVPMTGDVCDWNAGNGHLVSTVLHPRPGRVFRAMSEDGRRFVEIVPHGTAFIRAVGNAFPPVELADYSPREFYWFNHSGSEVAFHSPKGVVVICDTLTGRVIAQSEPVPMDCRAAAFSHDGRLLVTADRFGRMYVWNAHTGHLLSKISGGRTQIYCLAFTDDDSRFATGALDGSVTIWDTATRRATITLANQGATIFSLAFSPGGRQLVTSDAAGKVRIWDAPHSGQ